MLFQVRKSRPSKRKLFFPAGLLSLALIPLLGFQILLSDSHFHRPHVLEISYLSPRMIELVSTDFLPENIPVISIQGSSDERKQKIDSILYQINYLQKNRTDSSLLQINLEDQSTWGDFIAVLNTLKKQRIRTYIVNGNKVWVYPDSAFRPLLKKPSEAPKTNLSGRNIILEKPIFWCGTCRTISHPTIERTQQSDSLQLLIKTPKFLLFSVAFGLLLILNITLIKKS